MAISVSDDDFTALVREVRSLRDEIASLRASLVQAQPMAGKNRPRLCVRFEWIADGRFPFEMQLEGLITNRLRLSNIRVAIFLVLFCDLSDRQRGGIGFVNLEKKTWFKAG